MRVVTLHAPEGQHQMCAVEYCKRYGEHLLATKIVKFRKGELDRSHFIDELGYLLAQNEDVLMERTGDEV